MTCLSVWTVFSNGVYFLKTLTRVSKWGEYEWLVWPSTGDWVSECWCVGSMIGVVGGWLHPARVVWAITLTYFAPLLASVCWRSQCVLYVHCDWLTLPSLPLDLKARAASWSQFNVKTDSILTLFFMVLFPSLLASSPSCTIKHLLREPWGWGVWWASRCSTFMLSVCVCVHAREMKVIRKEYVHALKRVWNTLKKDLKLTTLYTSMVWVH